MSLAPGVRLGAYEIIAAIGAGGMGEVYRARDTRLGRSVALKVLHPRVAQDMVRRQRFEREAKAVALLNHPNICTLYDIGQHDGTGFLVMELLDGETLARRLLRGALPLPVALRHALEIAQALHQAHRCGIAHRDLKPANIMLTRSGAKLLDFGIAKLTAPAGPAALALDVAAAGLNPTSPHPTDDHTLTESGTILGTVEYMSPEQVRGHRADERSDIFAFGALLFEMVCGRRAFEGTSRGEVMRAILVENPAPMQDRLSTVPVLLERIVERCLEKDPDDRWQRTSDLVAALRWVVEGVSLPSSPAARAVELRQLSLLIPVALAGVLLIAGGWLTLGRTTLMELPTARWDVAIPSGQALAPELLPSVAISSDGSRVVFRAQAGAVTNLYLRNIDEFEARVIAGTENAHTPFFSPDDQWLGFMADGKVRKILLSGGSAQVVCDAPSITPGSPGATWSRDGLIVFAAGGSGLMVVPETGGTPQPLTTADAARGEVNHIGPQFLPGGQSLLFTARTQDDGWRVALLDMTTRQWVWLPPLGNIAGARYVSTGHIVYSRDGALHAVAVDLERRDFSGAPFPLGESVYTQAVNDAVVTQYAVSDNGTFAFMSGQPPNWTLVTVDMNGTVKPVIDAPHAYRYPRFSPDGRHLVVMVEEERTDLWLVDVARAALLRQLTSSGSNMTPVWTPDGSRIAFASRRRDSDSYDIYSVAVDDTVEPAQVERLFSRPGTQVPTAWTSDERHLLFYELNNETARDISTWAAADGSVEPLVSTKANERAAILSSDGRWLAFVSDTSGRDEVYVRPYPGPGTTIPTSRGGGTEPVWSRNGTELFYRRRNQLFAVTVTAGASLSTSVPRLLATGPYVQAPAETGRANYDVAPHGNSFVMVRSVAGSDAHLHIVQNWHEKLKRLVPTR